MYKRRVRRKADFSESPNGGKVFESVNSTDRHKGTHLHTTTYHQGDCALMSCHLPIQTRHRHRVQTSWYPRSVTGDETVTSAKVARTCKSSSTSGVSWIAGSSCNMRCGQHSARPRRSCGACLAKLTLTLLQSLRITPCLAVIETTPCCANSSRNRSAKRRYEND